MRSLAKNYQALRSKGFVQLDYTQLRQRQTGEG